MTSPENTDRIEDLDRKIHNLEEAATTRAADLLRSGTHTETIEKAVTRLENELGELRRAKAHLEAINDQAITLSNRVDEPQRLTEAAPDRLRALSPEQRRHVVELLDLHINVTDAGSRTEGPRLRIEGVYSDGILSDGNSDNGERQRL